MEQLTLVQVVARRVQELRKRRGWSAQALADRCAEAGFPEIKRQVITNLENGRRNSISLDEVLGLAYALDAPPVLLFVPFDGETDLQISPKVSMVDVDMLAWVSGEGPPQNMQEPPDRERMRRWREISGPVKLHHDLWMLLQVIQRDEWKEDEESVNSALHSLATVLDQMIEAGIRPPAIPIAWAERMRAHGWLKHPGEISVHTFGEGDGES